MSNQLVDLPSEVLVHIFSNLTINERLVLIRTCRTLKNIHDESSTLQYELQLSTSAYLDVSNQTPAVLVSEDGPVRSPVEDPASNSFISPHTGRLRPSIQSVKLAPFPEDPSPRPSTVNVSTAEKFRLLKEREENWDTLTPKKIRKFSITGHAGIYELQEGIFLMCDDYREDPNSLLRQQRPYVIRLIPLPSSVDPDLEDPIIPTKSAKVKLAVSDLTMDPTQDLLVASEFVGGGAITQLADPTRRTPTHRFHLLSMSTFEPHPLAIAAVLDFPPTDQFVLQTRQLLQVMGDILITFVSRHTVRWIAAAPGQGGAPGASHHDEEIACWNWKTGRLLARTSLPDNGWPSSMAMLSPTTFMITSTTDISQIFSDEPRANASVFPPVIKIYSFAPDTERDIIPIPPYDVEHNDDTTPRPVLVAQLHLPPVAEGAEVRGFDVRPDPAFPPSPLGYQPTLGQRKPFTQDPAKGVLVFDIKIGPDPVRRSSQSYDLFVLREYLVQLAAEGQERLRRSRLKSGDNDRLEIWDILRNVAWNEWGPRNSRLLSEAMPNRQWVCSCSGYRWVCLTGPEESSNDFDRSTTTIAEGDAQPADLLLLDFSPHSVRRHQQRSYDPLMGHDIIDESLDEETDNDNWSDISDPLPPPGIDMDSMTCVTSSKCWKEDVWTGLPYVRVQKEMGVIATGVMMDDQRVMMINTEVGDDDSDLPPTKHDFTVLCM